jgi:hypothetical protein
MKPLIKINPEIIMLGKCIQITGGILATGCWIGTGVVLVILGTHSMNKGQHANPNTTPHYEIENDKAAGFVLMFAGCGVLGYAALTGLCALGNAVHTAMSHRHQEAPHITTPLLTATQHTTHIAAPIVHQV